MNNIQYDTQLEQKIRILTGQTPAQVRENQLSEQDKEQIRKSVSNLFSGMAWTNWLNGATLGRAWHQALMQLEGFASSKKSMTPATKYLREYLAWHKADWSKAIMTNPYTNDLINCPKGKEKEWGEGGIIQTKAGLSGLNAKIKEFEPKRDELSDSFDKERQNLALLMLRQYGRSGRSAA